MSYQAVDLTQRSKLRYKTAPGNINDYLYNYDKATGERLIIVEGILDAWRVGGEALATFGTHLTTKQMRLIIQKKPKEVIFAWDNDAYFKAREEADKLRGHVPEVIIAAFPQEYDPDSFGKEFGHAALIDLLISMVALSNDKKIK